MTKPKTLDQLRAEKERAETQLAQEQHKLERLENRKKYLEKGERTKRTRPCFSAERLLQPAQKGRVSNLKEMNETFNYLRANGIYTLEDWELRVSEHGATTESLKKTLDGQTARMKAIKQLYDGSAVFRSLKFVYDGLQKIKFEKPRAEYKAEHEAELKQFYAVRRKLTEEFPDGKVDIKIALPVRQRIF